MAKEDYTLKVLLNSKKISLIHGRSPTGEESYSISIQEKISEEDFHHLLEGSSYKNPPEVSGELEIKLLKK